MHRLNILIVQARPSHQIILHQACNALGAFNVRIAADLPAARVCLAQSSAPDLLVIDHGMPTLSAQALLRRMARTRRTPALLFVGQPASRGPDLAVEARRQGLWVLAQLPWPLSAASLHGALQRLCRRTGVRSGAGIETVMLPTHAR